MPNQHVAPPHLPAYTLQALHPGRISESMKKRGRRLYGRVLQDAGRTTSRWRPSASASAHDAPIEKVDGRKIEIAIIFAIMNPRCSRDSTRYSLVGTREMGFAPSLSGRSVYETTLALTGGRSGGPNASRLSGCLNASRLSVQGTRSLYSILSVSGLCPRRHPRIVCVKIYGGAIPQVGIAESLALVTLGPVCSS
ncbi:hypothetical protein POSPLADRAFT_1156358 [Postia placenta MAD-698-R-SB12]|uniref:Uncharacterized protein n=1 Tax=Postia placenta MAD-698-R-SB12 TaxID=670580 RepID=A0A1X6MN54_9APHY|nr:hypothetical protein POSPLADRAFT_1156358 [Postia placenta MAD-698-R-SB12]OSX57622.1 hypothetical protein POSPLADRAFT_1156358 [Postia placenta MAD-698-R-SB12]